MQSTGKKWHTLSCAICKDRISQVRYPYASTAVRKTTSPETALIPRRTMDVPRAATVTLLKSITAREDRKATKETVVLLLLLLEKAKVRYA